MGLVQGSELKRRPYFVTLTRLVSHLLTHFMEKIYFFDISLGYKRCLGKL